MGDETPLPPQLDGVRAKIRRAEHHVRDLDGEVGVFLRGHPYEVG